MPLVWLLHVLTHTTGAHGWPMRTHPTQLRRLCTQWLSSAVLQGSQVKAVAASWVPRKAEPPQAPAHTYLGGRGIEPPTALSILSLCAQIPPDWLCCLEPIDGSHRAAAAQAVPMWWSLNPDSVSSSPAAVSPLPVGMWRGSSDAHPAPPAVPRNAVSTPKGLPPSAMHSFFLPCVQPLVCIPIALCSFRWGLICKLLFFFFFL